MGPLLLLMQKDCGDKYKGMEETQGRRERGSKSVQKACSWKKGMWKMNKKKSITRGVAEASGGKMRTIAAFGTLAFYRTERAVCLFSRFPIHSICGIEPLFNNEQNKKSQPNLTTVSVREWRERGINIQQKKCCKTLWHRDKTQREEDKWRKTTEYKDRKFQYVRLPAEVRVRLQIYFPSKRPD